MAKDDFKNTIEKFISSVKPFYTNKDTPSSYGSYLNAIQRELDRTTGEQILEDWILKEFTQSYSNSSFELIDHIENKFKELFGSTKSIGSYSKSQCHSALIAFAKYILGQYKANLYVALDLNIDKANCILVARNAIFCTVDVANGIKEGKLGSKLNKKHSGGNGRGNKYFSWYCYRYQRKAIGQPRNKHCTISKERKPDPESIIEYILDNNSMANQAIKRGVIEGLPEWMKLKYNDFEDYMACHIWDKTCYDYRYHTSMFNLVLLPKSIGGLSDYCKAVKEMLQYEAAMRFGVYPEECSFEMSDETKKIYDSLHDQWRQPDEHKNATERKEQPEVII